MKPSEKASLDLSELLGSYEKPRKLCFFIHPDDQKIFNSLIFLDKKGPWVAGGACLSWFQNKSCSSDIDLYFKSEKQFDKTVQYFVKELANSNFVLVNTISTDNAITYNIMCNATSNTIAIQFIKKNFFNTPQDVIESFDITVCQIAWDGNKLYVGDNFANDLATKTLRFNKFSPASHKRLVKYMCYGFIPHKGCIETLIQSPDIDWLTKGSDHYA